MKILAAIIAVLAIPLLAFDVSAAATSLADGLVAHYPFDGNADDQSGNDNHGSVTGAVLVPDRFGSPGSAYRFDGDNDFISVPDSPSLNLRDGITISVWVQMDDAGASLPLSQYLISKGFGPYFDTLKNTYSLYLGDPTNSSRSITFELSDGTITRTFTPEVEFLNVYQLDPGRWYHLAATWGGQMMRLYLDGVPVIDADKRFGGPINTHIGALNIGRLGDRSSYFDGTMDELRIYDRALSLEEIQNIYFGRLECLTEASYTAADIQQAFENGYAAGFAEARGGARDQCASFDGATGTLHVPCLDLGTDPTLWLDLILISSEPIQLQLDGFGQN